MDTLISVLSVSGSVFSSSSCFDALALIKRNCVLLLLISLSARGQIPDTRESDDEGFFYLHLLLESREGFVALGP